MGEKKRKKVRKSNIEKKEVKKLGIPKKGVGVRIEKRVELNQAALKRLGPGIRRLLSMNEADLVKAKQADERRLISELERLKAVEKKRMLSASTERPSRELKPTPHPVFGPLKVDFVGRKPRVRVRAIVNFSGNKDDLRSLGITVHSGTQNVFTITATPKQLALLAIQAATQRISLPRIFLPLLNDAVPTAEVDQIHALGTRGNGTIVGVIDGTLHIVHRAFRDPAGAHNTRVAFMWVQETDSATASGQTPEAYFQDTANHPNSPDFTGLNYGRIYDEAAINTAIGQVNPYGPAANQISKQPSATKAEHGTHVAGIAAGNGEIDWATAPDNIGSAPLADIVHVRYRFSTANAQNGVFEDDILNALDFILRIAAHNGQPVVINNSYGSNLGPHNGLTDFDQARNAMLDSFTGRTLVYSAGNDNSTAGYRKGTIGTNSTEALTLTPHSDWTGYMAPVWLEVWYSGPDLDFRVDRGANSSGWITNEFHGTVGAVSIDVDRETQTASGLKNLRFYIQNTSSAAWTISLRNTSTTNTVNYTAWTGLQGWWASINGTTVDEMTLGDTCCARALLSVGACDKQIGGNTEMIADYSGRGPTKDGRIKPEITAVGGTLARQIMSADSRTTGGYVGMQGTSMAGPLVAGAVALLFEGNPDLEPDTIKGLLVQTADQTGLDINPAAAGYDPNERNAYGYGRLRMLAPFQHSLPLVDVDVLVRTAQDDFGFEPYPGGCCCHAPEVEIIDSNNNETNSLEWGKDYTVRVKIHNLGDTPAIKTKAQIKYTRPWTAPNTWTPCTDPSDNPTLVEEVNIPALGSITLTFANKWRPKEGEVPPVDTDFGNHFCLLVELDHQQDPLTFDNNSAAGGEAWGKNIKGTNNVALRNLAIK